MVEDGRKNLIWIVEDEPGAQFLYKRELGGAHEIRPLLSLAELEKALQDLTKPSEGVTARRPDLLVCDLSLPDGSFLDFLNQKRTCRLLGMPLLVVTANDDIEAIKNAYTNGVLDYLVKPFNMNALSFKIDKFLGEIRQKRENADFLKMDSATHSAGNRHGSVGLTTKEFQIVTLMLKSPNKSVSREDIIANVWHDVVVSGKNLEVQLSRLRKKLTELSINVVYEASNGYCLREVVEDSRVTPGEAKEGDGEAS